MGCGVQQALSSVGLGVVAPMLVEGENFENLFEFVDFKKEKEKIMTLEAALANLKSIQSI